MDTDKFKGRNIENFKLNLLYKMTKDGSKACDFHKLCDYKADTITVIKTDAGTKFGGYLSVEWKSSGGDISDKSSFLFSLDKDKIYTNTNGTVCVFAEDRGPYFAYSINVFDDFELKNKHEMRTLDHMRYSWKNFSFDYELNNGRRYLNISEIEVFEIINQEK